MLHHLLVLSLLARHISSGPTPLLQWDPATVADCAGWYDNGGGDSCEYIRKIHGISPAEFHSWNPSVSFDCEPWDFQSYCIITQEKLDRLPQTSSTTPTRVVPSTTSATETRIAPSPTAWEPMGCYAEYPEMPILEKNTTPEGDPEMSVGKCQDACYRRGYRFAGLQEGDQCWCSSYVGGEWTEEQDDCNMPCTGDGDEMCGGKGVLSVFRAMGSLEFVSMATTTTMGMKTGTGTVVTTGTATTTTTSASVEGSESSAVPVTTAVTGGAARNGVLW